MKHKKIEAELRSKDALTKKDKSTGQAMLATNEVAQSPMGSATQHTHTHTHTQNMHLHMETTTLSLLQV